MWSLLKGRRMNGNVRGKFSIKVNSKTIIQKSKEKKGLRMPIKRRKPMDTRKHSYVQVDFN
jgi:hypothetical protein